MGKEIFTFSNKTPRTPIIHHFSEEVHNEKTLASK